MNLSWTYPIIETWLHIIAGLAIMFFGGFCLYIFVKWVRSIQEQNRQIRIRDKILSKN